MKTLYLISEVKLINPIKWFSVHHHFIFSTSFYYYFFLNTIWHRHSSVLSKYSPPLNFFTFCSVKSLELNWTWLASLMNALFLHHWLLMDRLLRRSRSCADFFSIFNKKFNSALQDIQSLIQNPDWYFTRTFPRSYLSLFSIKLCVLPGTNVFLLRSHDTLI